MTTHADWIDAPAPALLIPDLRGSTAVVTGVSMGIGRATAEPLLENGTRVVGLSRVADRWTHPDLLGLSCDLSDGQAIEAAFREITSRVEPRPRRRGSSASRRA